MPKQKSSRKLWYSGFMRPIDSGRVQVTALTLDNPIKGISVTATRGYELRVTLNVAMLNPYAKHAWKV